MTYSFGVRGICKADALLELDNKVDKLDNLLLYERTNIYRHAREVVANLDDPNYSEELVILCHGYSVLSKQRVTAACCSVSAFIMVKV